MRGLPLLSSLVLAISCAAETQGDQATVRVERGDLVFSSSFYGEVEARASHVVLVPEFRNVWQITIESVIADGARVAKGDTVLVFANVTCCIRQVPSPTRWGALAAIDHPTLTSPVRDTGHPAHGGNPSRRPHLTTNGAPTPHAL